MKCDIVWLNGSLEPWVSAFDAARRSTLLQHLPYALAMRDLQQLGMRQGMIYAGGALVGVVQIGEAGIFNNSVHAVSLDRGPIFFDAKPPRELVEAFFQEFRKQFRARWGRKLRIIPELHGVDGRAVLERCGFRPNPRIRPYRTAWLDLSAEKEHLRRSLKGKWRNALGKAERSAVEVGVDRDLSTLPAFLEAYRRDMQVRNFAGPRVDLIVALIRYMRARDDVLLVNATEQGRVIASVLILQHGIAATYQCGWTTVEGRSYNAHHLLLWTAIGLLKDRGILDLDLGGLLADEDEPGLRRFKMGLGGREVELVGAFH